MNMKMADLDKTATVENTRVSEQAGMKHAPLVNEIRNRISIL